MKIIKQIIYQVLFVQVVNLFVQTKLAIIVFGMYVIPRESVIGKNY